jgi:hypothetical protein
MDETVIAWVWVSCLGGVGGAVSAWLAPMVGTRAVPPGPVLSSSPEPARKRVGQIAWPVTIAAATAAATAWMIGLRTSPATWIDAGAFPAALAFVWIGFVTVGWMAAERDKRVLRQAVCRAATAPAAHPDTVRALAHASPDAVYETVQGLVPRRVVH